LPFDLANATTSAFYFGDTLQHITDAANKPSLKNASAIFFSENANAKVGPSMTIAIRLRLDYSFLISTLISSAVLCNDIPLLSN
jgi:hypothetical protein